TSDGLQLFVFDTSGRHVATAAFPVHAPRWFPLIIRGDRIHALITDSLDVPAVMRFRIRESAEAGALTPR
ncbi:MAG: hypothetical protein ACM357_10020, partial [Gemmatimonadota bacterium]